MPRPSSRKPASTPAPAADTPAPELTRRPLRWLTEEGLFRCPRCQAVVLHAPAGDVSGLTGEPHACAETNPI